VVGTDFTPEMIALARAKSSAVEFEVADVTNLPYGDATFDVASIAFGIRNVADPARGIAEMARVVKPGGRVIVLELGRPQNALIRSLFEKYCRVAMPRVGGALTGQRDAYEYLETSSAQFPKGDDFVALMRHAFPFASVDYRPLTFGVAYLYAGVTPTGAARGAAASR